MVAVKDTSIGEMDSYIDTEEVCTQNPFCGETLYDAILSNLRRRLSLFVWQGFFEPLKSFSFSEDCLTLAAPSTFHRDWVQDHYLPELLEAATEIYKKPIKIKLVYDESVSFEESPKLIVAPQSIATTALKPLEATLAPVSGAHIVPIREKVSNVFSQPVSLRTSTLNPKYTFDNFVPGPSNQMGFAACNAVSEKPGEQYSPLFLFGSVGLGKTHLLHAIGHTAKQLNPKLRVLYMSAEQWVNEYIRAIRERKFDQFRARFRTECDLLLIDDIQFLAGKDASQDEFFHTFNSLHQSQRQIVVTSDKYPHEIEGLEERLKTRLSWGLIADIRPPEIETRIAILFKKAESCQIRLPNDVAHYLAAHVTSSVRELEGALLRLSAYSKVSNHEINLTQAREYLAPVFRNSVPKQLSVDRICQCVAGYYDLRPSDLKGKSRQKHIALARQIAVSLCRVHLSLSLPELGRNFGGRDHSTILSSIRKIDSLKLRDPKIQKSLADLEKELLASSSY